MPGMGYRTIKTALGAGIAIWITTLFHLEFATFSAIIVIMGIEKTRKRTLISMKEKIIASLLSLLIGALLFEVIVYHPLTFSLFIFLFIPILVALRIQGGFVTSMVVILHIYTIGKINLDIFLNEVYLIAIGMSIALLVNSIMPDLKRDMSKYKQEIEHHFSQILHEFSAHLTNKNRQWDGEELIEVGQLVDHAKDIAIQDVENHLLRKSNKDYYYLEMRAHQLDVLLQMMRIIAIIFASPIHVAQKEMIASFFDHLSKHVDAKDTTELSFHKLETCMESIRSSDLPQTREEFEVRANLFYLVFELENYLAMKRKLFAKMES